MSVEYDDKGKFFTNVISKHTVSVLIQTTRHLIRGKIHIRPEERIKDELDLPEPFLAVTEASLLDADGKELYHTDFLAVLRTQIIWVMPDDGGKGGSQ